MYQLNDTILAISSPTSDKRVIVRISGTETVDAVSQIFSSTIPEDKACIVAGSIAIDPELSVDAQLYLFLAPHSYTGETLAEIHLYTNPSVTEALISRLLSKGLRMAEAGEFTARAYLNGKIDLTQAEAVNEIIVSSNKYQLAAAEKMLEGRLAENTTKISASIMDCLSLIEAGLDFSQEDIEFITRPKIISSLNKIKKQLAQLLANSINCETVIDLPAVGIAGVPNAGKSSLLNKLLGKKRSIVSEQRKTTRDVLDGKLMLKNCQCVIFDCAGLTIDIDNILDELTQQAAIEALHRSTLVIFCVDVSKTDYTEDKTIRKLIKAQNIIPVATKSDLLTEKMLTKHTAKLKETFGAKFLQISSVAGDGINLLLEEIDKKIIEKTLSFTETTQLTVALTSRHKQVVTEAIGSIKESIIEIKAGNDEIAAMMLRTAYQSVSNIEQENIDEQILEKIFSQFCIGK